MTIKQFIIVLVTLGLINFISAEDGKDDDSLLEKKKDEGSIYGVRLSKHYYIENKVVNLETLISVEANAGAKIRYKRAAGNVTNEEELVKSTAASPNIVENGIVYKTINSSTKANVLIKPTEKSTSVQKSNASSHLGGSSVDIMRPTVSSSSEDINGVKFSASVSSHESNGNSVSATNRAESLATTTIGGSLINGDTASETVETEMTTKSNFLSAGEPVTSLLNTSVRNNVSVTPSSLSLSVGITLISTNDTIPVHENVKDSMADTDGILNRTGASSAADAHDFSSLFNASFSTVTPAYSSNDSLTSTIFDFYMATSSKSTISDQSVGDKTPIPHIRNDSSSPVTYNTGVSKPYVNLSLSSTPLDATVLIENPESSVTNISYVNEVIPETTSSVGTSDSLKPTTSNFLNDSVLVNRNATKIPEISSISAAVFSNESNLTQVPQSTIQSTEQEPSTTSTSVSSSVETPFTTVTEANTAVSHVNTTESDKNDTVTTIYPTSSTVNPFEEIMLNKSKIAKTSSSSRFDTTTSAVAVDVPTTQTKISFSVSDPNVKNNSNAIQSTDIPQPELSTFLEVEGHSKSNPGFNDSTNHTAVSMTTFLSDLKVENATVTVLQTSYIGFSESTRSSPKTEISVNTTEKIKDVLTTGVTNGDINLQNTTGAILSTSSYSKSTSASVAVTAIPEIHFSMTNDYSRETKISKSSESKTTTVLPITLISSVLISKNTVISGNDSQTKIAALTKISTTPKIDQKLSTVQSSTSIRAGNGTVANEQKTVLETQTTTEHFSKSKPTTSPESSVPRTKPGSPTLQINQSAKSTPDTSPEPPIPESSPKPPTPETSPEPPTPETSPEPPTPETSPEPPTPKTSPEPPTPETSPEPPTPETSPEPPTPETSPEPSTQERSPEPSTTETGAEPSTQETSPEPPAPETSPEPPTPETSSEPSTQEPSPEPSTTETSAEPSTTKVGSETDPDSTSEPTPEPLPSDGSGEPEPKGNETGTTLEPDAETTAEPEVTSSSNPEPESELDTFAEPGPDWEIAKLQWKEAWEFHIYFFGALFTLLGLYCVISVIRLWSMDHLLSRHYFLTLNFLVIFICVFRAIYLLVDAYNSNGLFPVILDYCLYNTVFPSITAVFSILFYALLLATRLRVLSPKVQKLWVLMLIIGFHFVFSFTTDIVVGLFTNAYILLFVCQLFFVLWGAFMFIGYFLIFRKLYIVAINKQNAIKALAKEKKIHGSTISFQEKPQKQRYTIGLAVKVTFVSALFGVAIIGCELYGMFGVHDIVHSSKPDPWPWWAYHTLLRALELLMCVCIAYVAAQPFKYTNKKRTRNLLMHILPCQTLCCHEKRKDSVDGEFSSISMDHYVVSESDHWHWRKKHKNKNHPSPKVTYPPHAAEKYTNQNATLLLRKFKQSMLVVEDGFVRIKRQDEVIPMQYQPDFSSASDLSASGLSVNLSSGAISCVQSSRSSVNVGVGTDNEGVANGGFSQEDILQRTRTDLQNCDQNRETRNTMIRADSIVSETDSSEVFRPLSTIDLAASMESELERAFHSSLVDELDLISHHSLPASLERQSSDSNEFLNEHLCEHFEQNKNDTDPHSYLESPSFSSDSVDPYNQSSGVKLIPSPVRRTKSVDAKTHAKIKLFEKHRYHSVSDIDSLNKEDFDGAVVKELVNSFNDPLL